MKYYTEIVPFELAKKLKEVGFDFPCTHYYVKHEIEGASGRRTAMHPKNWNKGGHNTSTPTYAKVFDWLIGKGVTVEMSINRRSVWFADIYKIWEGDKNQIGLGTFHEAANAAIEKACELLKEV